ncbi:MAG TPA: DUF4492 domain-containing protein [Desulfuromonadales bacterium]|nr:DUF4492 domain-containing protein [Desulfuromonadales bacterium]
MPLFNKIYRFYLDGFRSMKTGRTLWKVVLLKLFILFVVVKLLFFPDFLKTHFKTDQQRAAYVLNNLTTWPSASHSIPIRR